MSDQVSTADALKRLQLRVTSDDKRRLKMLLVRQGITEQAMLREAVNDWLEKKREKPLKDAT